MVTGSPAAQVRAALEAWRPHVDEVVLAVDERGDGRTLEACAHVADQLVIAPTAPYMERYLGWLHALCSGDWILRVDDDELPGAALAATLPRLTSEREPTHFWVPRLWAHPAAATYIAGGSWARDIQVRLVRNLPGLWRFSGALHSNIEVIGPSRVLAEPLLHLVTVLHSRAERAAKIDYYEEVASGLMNELGEPLNMVYLPEEAPDLQLLPLDAPDVHTAETFLDALEADRTPPTPVPADRPAATAAELDRWLTDRELSPGAYRTTVRLLDEVLPCRAGTVQHVRVEVMNHGDDWLPHGPDPAPDVALGHRWYDQDGTEIPAAIPRTPLTQSVGPGAKTRQTMSIHAPEAIGTLELRVDLVHEWVRWFERPTSQIVAVSGAPAVP